MATIFDRVQYLLPGVTGYVYWNTARDGTPWSDPYDGLDWQNTSVPKPTKDALMALDAATVDAWVAAARETERKAVRNKAALTDLSLMASYNAALATNPSLTLDTYLNNLETLAAQVTAQNR